LCGSDGA
jgi:hypothetical protein